MLKKLSTLLMSGVIAFTAFSVQATAASASPMIVGEVPSIVFEGNSDEYCCDSELIAPPTDSALCRGKKNMNKESIKKLQTCLKHWGYYSGEVDGSFGDLTKQSVKSFQMDNGLDQDGSAGRITLTLLKELVDEHNSAIKLCCETKAEESKIMDLVFPTSSTRITGMYGEKASRRGGGTRFHSGIDIGAPKGADVYAAADGIVVMNGWSNARGHYVVLYHEKYDISTLYEHLESYRVNKGSTVTAGEIIGAVGDSGFYYSGKTKKYYPVHLHFGIIRGLMEELSDDLWYVSSPTENRTLEPDPSYCENIIKYSYK